MNSVSAGSAGVMAAQVGIDVGKDRLDVSVGGAKAFFAPNTPEGCQSLVGRLPAGAVVHMESSGGYERLARRVLESEGFEVRTHDPLRARRMAQARGKKAKNDALDARALAEAGALLEPGTPKSAARQALCDLSRASGSLREHAADLRKHAAMPELQETARASLLRAADLLSKEAATLEKQFAKDVKASTLKERYELALSVPGVGPCLARALACELPEDLEPFSPEQLCSYAGLAPMDDSSGKRIGAARLGRGNARLKAALYMPAISLLKNQSWAKELYTRLKSKGKAHQQAAVAIMRRLLIRVIAVLKRRSPWEEQPHKKPKPQQET